MKLLQTSKGNDNKKGDSKSKGLMWQRETESTGSDSYLAMEDKGRIIKL